MLHPPLIPGNPGGDEDCSPTRSSRPPHPTRARRPVGTSIGLGYRSYRVDPARSREQGGSGRGLPTHLRPSGFALLLYKSYFYHNVMVRYARQLALEVRHQNPDVLSPWETEALFNSYLERLLAVQGVDPHAFRFDWRQEELVLFAHSQPQPLLVDYPTGSYPGMIVIRQRTSSPR